MPINKQSRSRRVQGGTGQKTLRSAGSGSGGSATCTLDLQTEELSTGLSVLDMMRYSVQEPFGCTKQVASLSLRML